MIEDKNSLITYLEDNNNQFSDYIIMNNYTIEDATLTISLAIPKSTKKLKSIQFLSKKTSFFEENEQATIQFKSTSLQKINKNVNFQKEI